MIYSPPTHYDTRRRDRIIGAALQAGHIEVDVNSGTIYTWRKQRGARLAHRRVMGGTTVDGYQLISVACDGEATQARGHRVVWIAAYGSIDPTLTIDHINGIRDDNRISNLRLLTLQENARDHHRRRNADSYTRIVTPEQCDEIRSLCLAGSHTRRELAGMYGVGYSRVKQIVRGEYTARRLP